MARRKVTPVTEVTEQVDKQNIILFRVKQDYRYNNAMSAGIGFTKAEPVEVNKDNPAIPELDSCEFLERV